MVTASRVTQSWDTRTRTLNSNNAPVHAPRSLLHAALTHALQDLCGEGSWQILSVAECFLKARLKCSEIHSSVEWQNLWYSKHTWWAGHCVLWPYHVYSAEEAPQLSLLCQPRFVHLPPFTERWLQARLWQSCMIGNIYSHFRDGEMEPHNC